MEWIQICLAAAVPILPGLALLQRIISKKGIGSQFIRFCVLITVVPLAGLLALRGIIDGNLVSGLLGAAMGYAFGRLNG